MRVVLSIGGSVLAPDLDAGRVDDYAAAVDALVAAGWEVGVVVGGGTVAREYIDAARHLGANEVELDRIGIDVTRINARLLVAALGPDAAAGPAGDYGAAGAALRRGEVAVMGGVAPGQTTDAVAAALAEDIGADLLVFATSADGVYDADPDADPDAERYDRLSPAELVDVVVPMSRSAGASAPVDLLAAKLIQRAGLRAVVLDGTDPTAVERAVLRGDHTGTDVVPEGETGEIDAWGDG
ncbi:MAG: UMP kinase [Haloferacaceae archaeon]